MRHRLFIFLFIFASFVVGCGPIGTESIIKRVGQGPITSPSTTPFEGKFKASINSGTSLNAVTAGNYRANIRVGKTTEQSSQVTNGGYKVSTSFENFSTQ